MNDRPKAGIEILIEELTTVIYEKQNQIMFLNNDIQFCKDWLSKLELILKEFNSDAKH